MLEASGDAGGMFLEKVPATYTSSTLYLTIATTCFSFLCNIKRIWRTMYQTTSYIGISFSENSKIKSLGFFSGFLLCVAITSFCKCRKNRYDATWLYKNLIIFPFKKSKIIYIECTLV